MKTRIHSSIALLVLTAGLTACPGGFVSDFDWSGYQAKVARFHAAAAAKLPAEDLTRLRVLLEETVAAIESAGSPEGEIDAAMELLNGLPGDETAALLAGLQTPVRDAFIDADGSLALASLAPAYFTAELMDMTLPGDLRRQLDEAFGDNLDDVRIRVEDAAREADEKLGAKGFAPGSSVPHFADGEPGLDTVAHEAAHVVQQRAGAATQATGNNPEPKQALDKVEETKKKLKAARKRLEEACAKYKKLYAACKRGDRDGCGSAKVDMLDLIAAAAEVNDALDEVNELLKELGEDPIDYEDLDEESF